MLSRTSRYLALPAFTIIFSLLLTGCDKHSVVKEAIKADLKDPDSVKWDGEFDYQDRVCLRYNAKNAYGGYSGYVWAWAIKAGDAAITSKTDEKSCSVDELRAWKEEDQRVSARNAEAEKAIDVLGKMKQKKLIAQDIQSTYNIPEGPCRQMAMDLNSFARLRAEPGSSATWGFKIEEGLRLIEQGQCVDFNK